jgi:hypothetical protein
MFHIYSYPVLPGICHSIQATHVVEVNMTITRLCPCSRELSTTFQSVSFPVGFAVAYSLRFRVLHRDSNLFLSSASPADAVVQYDVELIALIRANYWQKLVKGILPLIGMAMVPALLGLIGYHLYQKANRPKVSKKKLKEEKRNKSKKK